MDLDTNFLVAVPEAPTIPISPERTSLAKHNPTPLIIAVPQSGPITNSSFRVLFVLTLIPRQPSRYH